MLMRFKKSLAISILGAAALVGHANAAITDLVFFGDSISDTGNVLALTSKFLPPPFPSYPDAPGRFSDGQSWTEHFALNLGQSLGLDFSAKSNPSYLLFNGTFVQSIAPAAGDELAGQLIPSGNNYSYGGARTKLSGSAGGTTGLLGQLIAWDGTASILTPGGAPLTRAANPDTLYVVMAGANDLRDFRSNEPGAIVPTEVAENVGKALGLLAQAGARQFLISSLPDLGKTPEAVAKGLVAESTAATLSFNAALAANAALLNSQFGNLLDIRTIDFFGLVESVYDDAKNNNGLVHGITNVDNACIVPGGSGEFFFGGSTGPGCAVAAFSDDLHPSGAAHALLGDTAMAAAVP